MKPSNSFTITVRFLIFVFDEFDEDAANLKKLLSR